MAEKEFDLFCIGNALLDVFARDEGQVAEHYGITKPVQHIEIEKLKEIVSLLPEKTIVAIYSIPSTIKT